MAAPFTSSSILKALASLKLAVGIILGLCLVIATGTIVESHLDAAAAAKLVYRTWWLQTLLILLVINLTAVMIDRWPWQKRHAPFILAHIGIIMTLLGAWITVTFGLDGNLRIGIGEKGRMVSVGETEVAVYSSFDGLSYTRLFAQPVDFFKTPPEDNPISITLDSGAVRVVRYAPYALPSHRVIPSAAANVGAGLRFQLTNSRANFADWLVQQRRGDSVSKDLGPASLHLVPTQDFPKTSRGANEIFLGLKSTGELQYAIYSREASRSIKRGVLAEGAKVDTGWMGLELKILRLIPHAEEDWEMETAERPTELTNAAIQIEFAGKKHWVQLDDVLKLFTDKAVYILTYGHVRSDLGFEMFLKKFSICHYQGTSMASSYSSIVDVSGLGEREISMNEPLKYHGLTVYQASFQQNEKGEPIASIFSVNYDPGRWLKYLGCLTLVFGTIWLFYNKRKASRAMGPAAQKEV